jgi:hypothetical protein
MLLGLRPSSMRKAPPPKDFEDIFEETVPGDGAQSRRNRNASDNAGNCYFKALITVVFDTQFSTVRVRRADFWECEVLDGDSCRM